MIAKTVFAISLLAAAHSAFAQEAVPENTWTNSALSTAPAAAPSGTAGSGTPAPAAPLTRAEVRADLQIYRESGLAALNEGDAPMWYAPAYSEAQARYAALRASPHYAELVRSYEGRGADRLAAVGR